MSWDMDTDENVDPHKDPHKYRMINAQKKKLPNLGQYHVPEFTFDSPILSKQAATS